MNMNKNQESIYKGLKSIGEEISGFYLSGLKIINDDDLPSKTYFIAHSAREIDGGIRDILAPKGEKEKKQKELSGKEDLKKIKGHVASILVALDLPIGDQFALEYIDVATKFVNHTHRSGAFKPSRESRDIIQLWERYEVILIKLLGNFINQLKQIERILKFNKPTVEVLYTLKNIFRNKQKEHYFFNNLKKINWFKPLYENGFFSPEHLLDKSYWNQSEYLEYLSKQIKEGEIDKAYSEDLVSLIDEFCNYSINIKEIKNYRIWYSFIIILTNLPKDYVTDEIINNLHIYFKTKFDNTIQSDAIFKLIYSYFENDIDSLKHKSKIEKIIKLVFEISDNEIFKDQSTYESGKYYPIIKAYWLEQATKNVSFYKPIAKYCSNKVIYCIAENLLKQLNSDYISSFEIKSIYHLDEVSRNSCSVQTIYTTFLKNCCQHISSIRIIEIIRNFLSDNYEHRHFTKIALFLISKKWKQTKDVFFELIKNQDEKMLFSNSFLGDDLYFFLEEIAPELESQEAIAIEIIIENGSQNDNYYNKSEYLKEYKLRWYSALNISPFFKGKYEVLSKELNKDKDQIKPQPSVRITSGSVSPISIEEINSMPINELVEILKTFDPERSFSSPSVEGLTDSVRIVVKENPNLFHDNYELFFNVPYKHISSVFYGLDDAWKEGKEINWKNILSFIENYSTKKEFGTDNLQFKNSSFNHNHLYVIESFCRLLSAGLRKDERAFSFDLMPYSESIIFSFLEKHIKLELNDKDKGKLGSAMHAINSTTGIIIGCLLDYSLRKARLNNIDINTKAPKWSIREKEIYESLIENEVQEFYMYFGWRRRNFLFLDYEWTNNLLKLIPKKDIQTIKSYFGCHLLEYNNSTLDYNRFKDVYKRAINENWQVVDSTMGDNSIELHVAIFYIFNYEDLNDNEIITLLFKQKDIKKISSLIHSLSFKFDQYFEELTPKDKVLFKRKIYKVWEQTILIVNNVKDVDANDMPSLFYLLKFIDELNEENYDLIKRTSNFRRHGRYLDELIKNLNRLKVKGDVHQSCVYACEIFIDCVFDNHYYASIMQIEIIEFIEFLYKQESSTLKEYSNKICNLFAEKGQYFLRDSYEKQN